MREERKEEERPTALQSASVSAGVHQRHACAVSPGEELDNGIAQELQPLVVIDPGGGELT